MRFQKVVATNGLNDDDLQATPKTKWCVSQAEAASTRAKLVSDGYRRKDIETTEVDVPTDKAGLLEWLNENAS